MIYRIFQGPILGAIQSNVFLSNLFYADDKKITTIATFHADKITYNRVSKNTETY